MARAGSAGTAYLTFHLEHGFDFEDADFKYRTFLVEEPDFLNTIHQNLAWPIILHDLLLTDHFEGLIVQQVGDVGLGEGGSYGLAVFVHGAELVGIDGKNFTFFLFGMIHIDGVEDDLSHAAPCAAGLLREVKGMVHLFAEVDGSPDGVIVHHIGITLIDVWHQFGEIAYFGLLPRQFKGLAHRLVHGATRGVFLRKRCGCEAEGQYRQNNLFHNSMF